MGDPRITVPGGSQREVGGEESIMWGQRVLEETGQLKMVEPGNPLIL